MVLAKRNCRCRYGEQSGRLGFLHKLTGLFPSPVHQGEWSCDWGGGERQLGQGVWDGWRVSPPSVHKASAHHLHMPTLGGLFFRQGLCDLHRTTWEKPKAQKCVDTGAAGCQEAGFSSRTLNNRYQEKHILGPALPLISSMLPWMLHVPLWDSVFPPVKWKSCRLKQEMWVWKVTWGAVVTEGSKVSSSTPANCFQKPKL